MSVSIGPTTIRPSIVRRVGFLIAGLALGCVAALEHFPNKWLVFSLALVAGISLNWSH